MTTDNVANKSVLEITRTFDAPRDRVFQAWTEAAALAAWWGPAGMPIQVAKLDLHPGGIFHYNLQTPDGHTMWGKFEYHEITAPDKLIFTNSFSDEACNTLPHPAAPTWPLEILNTLVFTEEEGKTTLHMTGTPYNASEEGHQTFEAAKEQVRGGINGTLDQLETYLAKA